MSSKFTTDTPYSDFGRITIDLYSLDEYEAEGGIYYDGGNGGGFACVDDDDEILNDGIWSEDGEEMRPEVLDESIRRGREQFVCAMATSGRRGDEYGIDFDIERDLGVTDYYMDSAANVYLLRDWPADAPLAARCNVGA